MFRKISAANGTIDVKKEPYESISDYDINFVALLHKIF